MANLPRRSILGGATALPFIAAPALADVLNNRTTDRTAWDRAVAQYERTLAAVDAAYAADKRDGELTGIEDTHLAAYKAMLDTPSPDAEALAYKLRAAWGPDFDEEPVQQIRAVVFADALRLAGEAVSHG